MGNLMFTVVTGPPASGKTTYLRTHATPGDITIDFDTLAVALGSPHSHDHTAAITAVAREARHAALTAALRTDADIWLIHADPSSRQLGWYRSLGARIVDLNPGDHITSQRLDERRAMNGSVSNSLSW
jgi:predicted kinase